MIGIVIIWIVHEIQVLLYYDYITVLLAILAYRNVQQIAYRTAPLVRRELDKQLTVMALVQVFYNAIIIIPFGITDILMNFK